MASPFIACCGTLARTVTQVTSHKGARTCITMDLANFRFEISSNSAIDVSKLVLIAPIFRFGSATRIPGLLISSNPASAVSTTIRADTLRVDSRESIFHRRRCGTARRAPSRSAHLQLLDQAESLQNPVSHRDRRLADVKSRKTLALEGFAPNAARCQVDGNGRPIRTASDRLNAANRAVQPKLKAASRSGW